MDEVGPNIGGGAVLGAPERLPDGAVALQSRAQGDLPHLVALLHAALGLHVGQDVPQATTGSVAESMQRHPGRLHVPFVQLQVLRDAIQHRFPARVDDEVVHRLLEVGHVGFGGLRVVLGVEEQKLELGGDVVEHELELLGHWEDLGCQGGDVVLEGSRGRRDEVLGEGDANVPLLVLVRVHRVVAHVIGTFVRAHDVLQLVLRPQPIN